MRRPSRAEVDRSIRELEVLWRPPPDPDPRNADGRCGAAIEVELESRKHRKFTATRTEPQRGRR